MRQMLRAAARGVLACVLAAGASVQAHAQMTAPGLSAEGLARLAGLPLAFETNQAGRIGT